MHGGDCWCELHVGVSMKSWCIIITLQYHYQHIFLFATCSKIVIPWSPFISQLVLKLICTWSWTGGITAFGGCTSCARIVLRKAAPYTRWFNHIKPKLFWGLPGPRGGGGTLCPLQNFYIFGWLLWNLVQMKNKSWSKRWYHQIFSRPSCGGAFPQNVQNVTTIMKYDSKAYGMLSKSLIFEAVILILQDLWPQYVIFDIFDD